MISLYSGTPGSGKSLHAARDIYELSRSEHVVICNFPVFRAALPRGSRGGQYLYTFDNDDLTPSALVSFAQDYWMEHGKVKQGRIRLFIDEAQLLFNSRGFQEKGRKEWLSFFSQHRKLGFDIVLIAQFDRMLDRQIRCLIEEEYQHRNFSNFGKTGKVMRLLTFGDTFVCIKYYYPCSEKVGTSLFRVHKRYYSLYDTFNLFGGVAAASDARG